jgi:hypothetical protein
MLFIAGEWTDSCVVTALGYAVMGKGRDFPENMSRSLVLGGLEQQQQQEPGQDQVECL